MSTHIADGINLPAQMTNKQPATDVSLFDINLFEQRFEHATLNFDNRIADLAKVALEPLDFINVEASEITTYANNAVASGNELTPSEIVLLTAKSQEFMFHCQLTANIANRTSDGLQQLFRQQG